MSTRWFILSTGWFILSIRWFVGGGDAFLLQSFVELLVFQFQIVVVHFEVLNFFQIRKVLVLEPLDCFGLFVLSLSGQEIGFSVEQTCAAECLVRLGIIDSRRIGEDDGPV